MKKSNLRRNILIGTAVFIIGVVIVVMMVYNGVVLLNNPSREDYPVRGVDVSSYQGNIDWRALAAQGIQFAFIKATEGSGYQDPCYAFNYEQATKTNLRVGAYHFFSFDSSGQTQFDNFASVVSESDSMLPPVVDVEFYGEKEKNPPDAKSVFCELNRLLNLLEEKYGCKPILYATEKSYKKYIREYFNGYNIWIRSVVTEPRVLSDKQWTFWQYTNRATLQGYQGKEKYIDMNVFNGDQSEFDQYGK